MTSTDAPEHIDPATLFVHDWAGHPFQIELSRALAARGHRVVHAYCSTRVGCKGPLDERVADAPTLRVEGVGGPTFAAKSPIRRVIDEIRYGVLLAKSAQATAPDIVVSSNTPLISQWFLRRATRSSAAKFVFWQQDMLGLGIQRVLAAKLGWIGRQIGRLFVRLEHALLKSSHAVVVISPDYMPQLDRAGVSRSRRYVIENWAPLGDVEYVPITCSEAVPQNELVFLYSGTLGLKHDPSLLAALARGLAGAHARVVVASEGDGADHLKSRTGEPSNLEVRPFVEFDHLSGSLASADVLLALLEPEAGEFSVPSKVLTYLCAGRPILAAMPRHNLASRTIAAAGAGVVVEPGNPDALVSAGLELAANPALRATLGSAARRYAEATFQIATICDRFEGLVANLSVARAVVASDGSLPALDLSGT